VTGTRLSSLAHAGSRELVPQPRASRLRCAPPRRPRHRSVRRHRRDEYLPQEQLDGYDAIEWLAHQPWCNGNIGMMGTSYSGFTCLQVATHRPPASRESSRSSRPTIVPLTTCTTRRVGRSERSATCATTD